MKILDQDQINKKIQRLAHEIIEHNYTADHIILAGINNNGYAFAELLMQSLQLIAGNIKLEMMRIRLNPAKPLESAVHVSPTDLYIENAVLIVVDDVANTSRTLFYALKPFMDILPQKIETAVLVDRKHKLFPINVDYVGLSLATTSKDNIKVYLNGHDTPGVFMT